jgi:hypothetical protein
VKGQAKSPKQTTQRRRDGKSSKAVLPTPPSRRRFLRELFGIDPRSLAVFRIAIGVLLLVDLGIRALDLNAMYTDAGMFSRMEICRRYTTPWNWSFHFGGGSVAYQLGLFVISTALAVALVLGFNSRLATIGSWVMLISLQHRVPPIISGADILLRMLLFWGMFLPLGRVWSIDAWSAATRGASATEDRGRRIASVASAAILLQVAQMYLFTAIFKSNPSWWSGEAIRGALAHDFYATAAGEFLLQFPPSGVVALSRATLLLEWAAPFLLFFPWQTARLRLVAVAALAVLHVTIAICLKIDLFSAVALVGLLPFLPPQFWNARFWRHFPRVFQAKEVAGEANPHDAPSKPFHGVFSASQAVCFVLLLHVTLVNISGLPSRPMARLGLEEWRALTTGCGLGQKWNMFEETPAKSGWYVARAKLVDGSEVDLLRDGAPVSWSKPRFPARIFPTFRWRKIFREMAFEDEFGYQVFRLPVAHYLCRAWNSRNNPEKQIAEFALVYCMQDQNASPAAGPGSMRTTVRERFVVLDGETLEN